MTPDWNSTTTCSYSSAVGVVVGSTCVTQNDPITVSTSSTFLLSASSTGSGCGVSSSTPCYSDVSYLDFLFPLLVIIFFLSINAWGFFFSGYKRPIISDFS